MDDRYEQNGNHQSRQEVNLWQQYLSIDERKSSTLQICLVVSLLFAGINYVKVGDITANLATIITALIYAIAGINASNIVGNYLSKNNQMMNNGMNTNGMNANGINTNMTGLSGQNNPKVGLSQTTLKNTI